MASPKNIAFDVYDATNAPKSGLTLTFDFYKDETGASQTAPTITEVGSTGRYQFTPTFPSPGTHGIHYRIATGYYPQYAGDYLRSEDWNADNVDVATSAVKAETDLIGAVADAAGASTLFGKVAQADVDAKSALFAHLQDTALQIKQSTQRKILVHLSLLTTGASATGIAYNASGMTVYFAKQDGSAVSKTMVSADWTEIDAANMPGYYWLRLSTTDTDTLGLLFVYAYVSGTTSRARVLVEVVSALNSDLDTTTTASKGNTVALLGQIQQDVGYLHKLGNSRKLLVYLADSTTGLAKTGVAFGSVTVWWTRNGGTATQKTLISSDWAEISAANMPGYYSLTLSSGTDLVSTGGPFVITVAATGAQTVRARFELANSSPANDLASVLIFSGGAYYNATQEILLLKQSTARKLLVRLVDGSVPSNQTGTPKTGVAFGSVTVQLSKQGGSAVAKTLVSADWIQIDATNLPGCYWLQLSSSDTDTLGSLVVRITSGATQTAVIMGEVVTADTSDLYAREGAPAGASLAADIAAAKAELDLVKAKTDNLPASPAATSDVTALQGAGSHTIADLYAREGAPAGVSLAADIAAVYARQGSPAGVSLAADLAAVKSDTGGLRTDYTTSRAAKLDDLDQTLTALRDAIRGASSIDLTVLKSDLDAAVTAIRAKTDGLPASPASTGDVTSAVTSVNSHTDAEAAAIESALTDAETAINAHTDSALAAAFAADRALADYLLQDSVTHDADGNVLTYRLRAYDNATHLQAAYDAGDGATYNTGKLGEWITATGGDTWQSVGSTFTPVLAAVKRTA